VVPSQAQSKYLLDDAGWKPGYAYSPLPGQAPIRQHDSQPFAFQLLVVDDTEHSALGRELAKQWATLGVSVTVKLIPPGTTSERLADRDFQAILVDQDIPGDPDPYPF